MQNLIEYIAFEIFLLFTRLLGWKGTNIFARFLGDFFYFVVPLRKKVVLKNLRLAFPEKPESEIKRLARKSYRSFAITFLEVFHFPKMSKEEILSKIDVVNGELLKEIAESGKGGILLTGHVSNWELGALAAGVVAGKGVSALTKPQRNPYITKWYDTMRTVTGNKIINVGGGTKNLFNALMRGEVIGIVGDQRAPKENERVLIFNQPTPLYFGTASLALKTKVPVLLVFVGRKENGKYELVFSKFDYYDLLGKENAGVLFNQRFAKELEKFVRKYPEQWFWMHNIWKY